jgi:hypothetical protein
VIAVYEQHLASIKATIAMSVISMPDFHDDFLKALADYGTDRNALTKAAGIPAFESAGDRLRRASKPQSYVTATVDKAFDTRSRRPPKASPDREYEYKPTAEESARALAYWLPYEGYDDDD